MIAHSLARAYGSTVALAASLMVCGPQIAFAAAPAAVSGTGVSAAEPAEGLQEITVTARFREEKLQETPLAITAVSGDTLAAKHAVIFRQDFAGLQTIPHAPVDVDATKVSPKVGVDYKFTPDVLGYIAYSTGFRGGGFGPRPNDAYQVRSFKAEDLKTTEIGIKSEWLEHRLRWNSAIFYSRYSNLQEGFNTSDPFGVPWFSTVNVGASRIYGFEAELLAEPLHGLQLQGSFGYDNYKVIDAGGPIDPVTGQSSFGVCIVHSDGSNCVPPRTPKYTASGSVQYSFPVSTTGAQLTARLDTTYQSAVYFTDLTYTAVPGQGGYSLYNARVTWDSPGRDWSLAAFGTNLGNKFYYNGKLTLAVLGFEEGNPGVPRMWGVSLRRNF